MKIIFRLTNFFTPQSRDALIQIFEKLNIENAKENFGVIVSNVVTFFAIEQILFLINR